MHSLINRRPDNHPEAAVRAGIQFYIAAMCLDYIAGDRKAEAAAAVSELRERSIRKNGLNTSSRIASGIPARRHR